MSDNVYEKMWKELKEIVDSVDNETYNLDVESLKITMDNMESENVK